MKKDIIKLFQLRGVIFDSMEVKEHLFVKIRCARNWAMCPKCTKSTQKIHNFWFTKKLHCLAGLNKVFLLIKVRRFYCRRCRKPFTEHLPEWLNGKHRYTKIFEGLVIDALVSSNFLDVSRKYGASIPTLLRILKRRAENVEIPGGELILNVDEHSFSGRDLKIGVAEINNKKFLAVLDDDNQVTLENYFKLWTEEAKSRVLEVCIDMKQSYLTVLKEMLPDAKIVVDRFHVMREMLRQVDEIRKILQAYGEIIVERKNPFNTITQRMPYSHIRRFCPPIVAITA